MAVLGGVLAACLSPQAAAAEGLTLEAALALARERSFEILASRRRVSEAGARLRTRPALRDNPVVEGAVGARDASPDDFEVGLSQTFELGGRGGSRRDAYTAALSREEADAALVEREVLRQVRVAFLRGLHAVERLRQARLLEAGAAELERIVRRRHETGDVADLDLNVASSVRARARADLKDAEAAQASALTELRVRVGLGAGEPLSLTGDLLEERSYDVARLVSAIEEHPELRSLEAQLREAEAELRLGKGFAWPDLTGTVRYERDEGDRILWAGLSVSLPVFDRGQQLREVGRASADGLRAEVEAKKRVLQNQLQGALTLYELRLAAVGELASNAATLADSEVLGRRSYEAGQIGLAELLLLRKSIAEARLQWLDSLLELGRVRAELDALAGGSR
jgi:cobalt-zinc-cadmium efflux system outer membrane protein